MPKHPYDFFLNGFDPETDELTRRALLDVEKGSGLSPATLEGAGVRLFNGKTDLLKQRLHFAHVDGNPILRAHRLIEFPHVDTQGKPTRFEYKPFPSIQFKGEKEPRRYLQGKGDEPTPYILPDVWSAKDKANKPLWITEGCKKTLKLCQHGRLTIGLSGVWTFRAAKDRREENKDLWGDLDGFKWTGRTVFVGFDADLWTNPNVRRALYELSFTLYLRGSLLRFPMWKEAKGIDDFLVLQDHPEKALEALETGAKDLEGLICADHRNEIEAALFRVIGTRGGINERTLIEKAAKGLGIKAKDLKADIARHRHNELKQTVDNTLYPYFISEGGGVCRWRRERDGNEAFTELSNFTARITEDVIIDTGLDLTRKFTIEGGSRDRTFPKVSIKTSEFLNLNWVTNHWGNDAIIRAGQSTKDYLREFIQVHSNRDGVKRRTVFGHTGWRQINGTWAYLMANGAIGADGVDVELPAEFLETGRYCLPKTPEHEKEAFDAIFSFLDTGKADIFFPALAYVFLAPLTTLLDPPPGFSLFEDGERDSLKTSVAVLQLAFFGKHSRAGLSNFDSTSNAILHRAAILKDVLFLVDDLYPSSQQKEAQRKETVAQLIIRACGNRTGRGRLNPDASEKVAPIPRGMVILTGEELPGLQSTLSRIIAIDFKQGDIDPVKLTETQEAAHFFPHAMTSYILWLRDRISTIQEDFQADLSQLRRGRVVENKSKKIPEHLAYLRFAWKLFCTWMYDRRGINDTLRHAYLEKGYETFARIAERHAGRIEHEDPVKLFFEIINGLLTQGKLRLDHKDSGYTGRIGGDSGELIGYFDADRRYLLPVPTWHSVQAYLRFEGGHFPFSKTTLYETLERRGLLEIRGGKRIHTVRIGGKSLPVLVIRRGPQDPFTEGEEKENDEV